MVLCLLWTVWRADFFTEDVHAAGRVGHSPSVAARARAMISSITAPFASA